MDYNNIIYIASFAVLFSEVSGIMQYVKCKINLEWQLGVRTFKPFDCEKCMAWWLYLICNLDTLKVSHIDSWVTYIGGAAICSLTAIVILRIIKRL